MNAPIRSQFRHVPGAGMGQHGARGLLRQLNPAIVLALETA
jgi:hypothetical protein